MTRRSGSLMLALLITACGGAGDVLLAGIEGTGVVTGFGSVFVDGVEFSTDEVNIQINGESGDESDLRVGDVVTVAGRNPDDGAAIADRIVFDRAIGGPVEAVSIESDSGEIRVLEQTVLVDANTRFIGTDADTLASGDLVAVSALRRGDAIVRATSIEQLNDNGIARSFVPGDTELDVEGRVSNLTSSSFQLGDLTVARDAAVTEDADAPLENGALVEVTGTRADAADGPLTATRVEVRGESTEDRSGSAFVEGIITAFNSEDDFRVDNIPAAAGSASRRDNSRVTSLQAGLRVSLRGEFVDGRLVADSLQVEPEPDRRITARVTEVMTDASGVRVLGIEADVLPDTLYVDAREGADRALRIDRLEPGDNVELTGYADREGGFVVTRLTRISDSTTSSVRGPVDSRDSSSGELVVGGVRINTDSSTDFRDETGRTLSRDSFFERAEPGVPITAAGPDNAAGIDIATTVKLLPTELQADDAQ
ncbi:DUF5666 domain-containing protein [Salinisphaera sp. P385]|uniref:DUF5666 domain-containing protein n=1 Tax=Spectribacter acetivorans TaxID=3075603 RepID=A0ABU3B8J3_9GAMM|nr:DUF5666 domain-containing protein [Salinisphaera sp. P385]MDT0618774.1 DUF5666 domain-containing protein [Salinisphaera sp. P385]